MVFLRRLLPGSCIEAGKTISNVADDVPLSGTMITGGQKPGKSLIVSAGVSSKEPSVRIAAADAKKCGTGGEEMLVISSGIRRYRISAMLPP